MIKANPVIAVQSVSESDLRYESLLRCQASHGGDQVLSNAPSMGLALEEELHLNPDGYYLTLSRFHNY